MSNTQQEDNNMAGNDTEPYIFRLYITRASPNSSKAITNNKKIFSKYLKKKYEQEIIDVYQQPALAKEEDIIALSLLVKKSPLPERKMIGDMSDIKKVLNNIGLSNGDEP